MKRTFLSLVSMAFIAAMTLTSCDEIMSAIDNPVDSYLQVDGPELYVAEGSSIEVACATISDGEVTFTVADAKVAKVEKVEPHMAKVTGLKVGETDVIVKLAATEYYKAAEAKVKIIVKPTYSLKDAVVDGAKLKIGYKLNNGDCEFVYEFDGEKKVFNLLPDNSAVPQAMDAYDITMTYDENAETITHEVVSKENNSDVPLVLNLYTGGSFDRVFRLANEMKSLQVNGYEMLPYVPESYIPVAVITAGLLPDNMKVGDQGLYTISFTPDKTTNQVIVFSSTNPDIITIDEKGAFKAIAVGEATIKAVSAENPTKVCEQTITVEEAGITLNLTSPAVGQLICDDGKNYEYGSVPSGVKAVAKICYVSGTTGRALALKDDANDAMKWVDANSIAVAHQPVFSNGTWRLPNSMEWQAMRNASGGNVSLRNGFEDVGGTNMGYAKYWGASVSDTNATYIDLYSSAGTIGDVSKDSNCRVRACLVF